MKKMRKAHLWIGLIASVLIFIESITGLLMNEPWLIGQTQMEGGKGNFQAGQFNRGQFNPAQGQINQGQAGQTQGQVNNQTQGQAGSNANGQFQGGPPGLNGNQNFAGRRNGEGTGSFMSTIRGLHEGRLGTTDIKWLIDLAALAMMFLTGSGIYLSLKVLRAERKRKKRQSDNLDLIAN